MVRHLVFLFGFCPMTDYSLVHIIMVVDKLLYVVITMILAVTGIPKLDNNRQSKTSIMYVYPPAKRLVFGR